MQFSRHADAQALFTTDLSTSSLDLVGERSVVVVRTAGNHEGSTPNQLLFEDLAESEPTLRESRDQSCE